MTENTDKNKIDTRKLAKTSSVGAKDMPVSGDATSP